MPLLLLLLFLPFFFILMLFNLAAFSFTRLGVSPAGAMLLLTVCIVGSVVNIPISRSRVRVVEHRPRGLAWPYLVFYTPPLVQEQVLLVNLGGAVIPSLFSLYLLLSGRAPLGATLLAILIVSFVCKHLARPVLGRGIALPFFIPPLATVLVALLLGGEQAAPMAYVSGALGTLIGADLLNLGKIRQLGAQAVSIGGAGVFDGIFLVAIVAAFLT